MGGPAIPCRGGALPAALLPPEPWTRLGEGPTHIPALRPAHLRSASGHGVAGAPHQPTGLREPSWGHLVSGPREAQAPVMDQEGIEVTVGVSRLTPSQSCGVSSILPVLRQSPRLGEGPRAACSWRAFQQDGHLPTWLKGFSDLFLANQNIS